jgi:hypothetical protein
VEEKRQLKSMSALTDYLLHNAFHDRQMEQLSEAETANERMSFS